MSAFEELLLVLAALYALACTVWLRREAIAFRAWPARRFGALAGLRFFGSDVAGALFVPPLPPLGRTFVAWLPIVSIDEEGVVTSAPSSHNPGERVPRESRAFAWSELAPVRADEARVVAGRSELLRAGSRAHAAHLARVIEAVRSAAPGGRGAILEREVERALDVATVRERIAAFERATTALRVACNVELAWLAVLLPAVGFTVGLGAAWPWLLGTLAIAHPVVLVLAWRSHAALYPSRRGDRAMLLVSNLLLPTSAARAIDALGIELLVEHHPLGVARALLRDEDFAELAERVVRDALHPLPPPDVADRASRSAVEIRSHARLTTALIRCAKTHGVAPERWSAPPERIASDCVSFCPRCKRQYVQPSGECSACFGVALVPF